MKSAALMMPDLQACKVQGRGSRIVKASDLSGNVKAMQKFYMLSD